MKILMASHYRPKELFDCLHSFEVHIGKSQRLCIYDNGSDLFTQYILSGFSARQKLDLIIVWGKENIGKAAAINYLFDWCCVESDIICSLDSDMILEEDIFPYAEAAVKSLDKSCIVAASQNGNDCHLYWKFRNNTLEEVNFPEIDIYLTRVVGGRGIAGGCLFMPAAVFKKLGGYAVGASIYGGNESSLLNKFSIEYGRNDTYVCPHLYVFHPYEVDKEYAAWKVKCQQQLRKDGVSFQESYFENKELSSCMYTIKS